MDYYLLAKLGHFLGIAVGVGGAIASDILFMRSVKDKKITRDEVNLLDKLAMLVWVGLGLFLVSGIAYILIQYNIKGEFIYFASGPFKAKLIIFCALLINAFVFHKKVFPLLHDAYTKNKYKEEIIKNKNLVSIVGAISITSWIYLLLLGTFRTITPKYFSMYEILGIYVALVTAGYIVSVKFFFRK